MIDDAFPTTAAGHGHGRRVLLELDRDRRRHRPDLRVRERMVGGRALVPQMYPNTIGSMGGQIAELARRAAEA